MINTTVIIIIMLIVYLTNEREASRLVPLLDGDVNVLDVDVLQRQVDHGYRSSYDQQKKSRQELNT